MIWRSDSRYVSGGPLAPQSQFRSGANQGNGRAQLVRGVGGELRKPLDGRFQACQHTVPSLRQALQFVAEALGTARRCERFWIPMDCAARVISSTGARARRLIQ